ncbi:MULTISPECIES: histone-like nucleoid-structuring protein, MvaT/MvaU family [unclassified Halomonas]|uniref:histone-like nucleoid-structuring protein, MvaT/MvaU family n=1 Tax=unclassified Halomonas TaxID=2609666 RepID=UPI00207671AB|nr:MULTISPECIES: histone-like nucleoid-structuring protein, MvaT/MvaU family [unclassified Halomonas]
MSLLNEYMQKEQQLKQLQEDLQRLEGDQRLKGELEFKSKLEALMNEFGKKPADVIAMLDPSNDQRGSSAAPKASAASSNRRKRRLKVYKNPHTGEVIETRGGNHKGLRSWKDEYGDETVESWLEQQDS